MLAVGGLCPSKTLGLATPLVGPIKAVCPFCQLNYCRRWATFGGRSGSVARLGGFSRSIEREKHFTFYLSDSSVQFNLHFGIFSNALRFSFRSLYLFPTIYIFLNGVHVYIVYSI